MEPGVTRISRLPSKKEAITVTSFTARGPPRHTVSFPARMQSFRGKLAGAHRKRGPEQQVLLRNTHLVFSGRRGPPVPNFSCLLRTSRGGFAAEFTNAILATLPVGGQRETLLRSNLL